MSVLIVAEPIKGKFKKSSFDLISYGRSIADKMNTEAIALVLGEAEGLGELGSYGAHKILHDADAMYNDLDSQQYTAAITEIADQINAEVIVVTHSSTGKHLAGRIAARLDASCVTAVNSVPEVGSEFLVDAPVFAGKAFATYSMPAGTKVLSLMGNAIAGKSSYDEVSPESISIANKPARKVSVISRELQDGLVPLPEAELVVSAGRGMKGPDNWGIVEELADVMKATTACSRPVADSDWRPHHEHVGQTGVAIRPNLYIAIGISGAIQHLAGVNSSKVIVVINKDPEAPFFKAADYGVVADLFDVVPRLTESIKKFQAAQA